MIEKTKDRYHNCGSKEKAPEYYYIQNKEVSKNNANKKYKKLPEKQKEEQKEYGRGRYKNMKSIKEKLI